MKNNFYTQMQMDVMNTANNMVVQQLCAEKGIDYNQMLMQAQQEHMQRILMLEQQRQMEKIVKRHYQQGSGNIFSKVRDAFTDDTPNMFMPMMNMNMGMPMQPQQPVMQQEVAPFPAQDEMMGFFPEAPKSNTESRIDVLEDKMDKVHEMLGQLTEMLKK